MLLTTSLRHSIFATLLVMAGSVLLLQACGGGGGGGGGSAPTPTVKPKIVVGSAHVLTIRTNGTLWAWGYNAQGQLGDGNTANRSDPVQIGNATNWVSIAAGDSHSLALRSDGTLWTWGSNGSGQLGDGLSADRHAPVQVGIATNWMRVAGGSYHSLAVRSDGTLWAWGNNQYGQLGDNSTTDRNVPVQVGIATNWMSVAAGEEHTLALRSDGTLWAWGYSQNGRLGTGGGDELSPVQVGSATWSDIAAGSIHSLGVQTNGTLWGWGSNGSGELGLGGAGGPNVPTAINNATDWASVAATGGVFNGFSIAGKTNGSLLATGTNRDGQLGLGVGTSGQEQNRSVPTATNTTGWAEIGPGLGRKTDGTLWQWGRSAGVIPTQAGTVVTWTNIDRMNGAYAVTDGTLWWVSPPFGISQFGTGTSWNSASHYPGFTSLGRQNNGTLWAWGCNYGGNFGNGAKDNACQNNPTGPVQVGTAIGWTAFAHSFDHVLGILNGTLWAWGQNYRGQLGDGSMTERLSPVQIGNATNWTKVAVANGSTLALRADGALWGWGDNIRGNLAGVGGPSPTQIGTATNWVDVAASGYNYYTLAVRNDGTLWSWGSNGSGQLGDGTKTERATPTQIGMDTDWVQVAMGNQASFARKRDGSLWSWGYNYYGDLGLGFSGQAQNRNVFTAVALP